MQRRAFSFIALVLILAVSSSLGVTLLIQPARAAGPSMSGWVRIAENGIDNPNNRWISFSTMYRNEVYSTARTVFSKPTDPVPLWRYDGSSFKNAAEDRFGNPNTESLVGLMEYKSELYCGTQNHAQGAELYRTSDGTTWSKVSASILGDPADFQCDLLTEYDGKLVVALHNSATGIRLYGFDGANWTSMNTAGFGALVCDEISNGTTYRGRLYVCGISTRFHQSFVLAYNGGTSWEQVAPANLGDVNNTQIRNLLSAGDTLYVSAINGVTGGEIWAYDGSKWRQVGSDGLGNASNTMLMLAPYGGELYISPIELTTTGITGVGKIYRMKEGGSLEAWTTDGLGDSQNSALFPAAIYQGKLLVSTYNEAGSQIWTHPILTRAYYFAEGSTRNNPLDGKYEEWLSIQNSVNWTILVYCKYMLGSGESINKEYSVPPLSRLTIDVNSEVPPENDVSVMLRSNDPFLAERPMYFNYRDKWRGGDVVMGSAGPSLTNYFAEGSTRDNPVDGSFETWICVQNLNESAADITIRYFIGTGGVVEKNYSIPPWTRNTRDVGLDIGKGHDASILVQSSAPVVAERPMYFNYRGVWPGGHVAPGAQGPSQTYYFAEGTTRPWANEWLCIQNPNESEAVATIDYQAEGGDRVSQEVRIPKNSRKTVDVTLAAGKDKDLSASITSDLPVVAERATYFDYQGMQGGHVGTGAQFPLTEWYFAEGCTLHGNKPGEYFETYLTLQNPGDAAADAKATYMLPTGGNEVAYYTIPAHGRVTVRVSGVPGLDNTSTASTIQSTGGVPIVCERSMYFRYYDFAPGGDCTKGYGM